MLTLALVFTLLTAAVATGKWSGLLAGPVPAAHATAGTFYGVNQSWLATAAQDWPQKDPNWCGVANVELIANYGYQVAVNNAGYFPFHAGGQQTIFNDMNSDAAISQWGYAIPGPNDTKASGIKADIALDGGTDPRAIAWGILYESPAGVYLHTSRPGYMLPFGATRSYSYHDVIYHGDVSHAVGGLARALERYHLPVSVTMAHGLHSDVVSGVYATNDPIGSYPANVVAVNAWDPAVGTAGGGYQSARMVTWDNYTFNTDPNMWGSPYSANSGYDPDPSVGIYTPTAQYPHHWITFLTDIEPDNKSGVSVDFALDENGNVMQHP